MLKNKPHLVKVDKSACMNVQPTLVNKSNVSGADPGFHLGGGGWGRKRVCARMLITSAEPNSLSAGVQGPLKGPGSSIVFFFNTLSCYLSLIF